MKQKKSMETVRIIPIKKIQKITFSANSPNLCVIHVLQDFDYLIELFRRSDMNIFILESFKSRNITPIYNMEFKENFNV